MALRSEFNNIAPGRDHGSDGWIGDAAHAASQSDHNPAPDGGVHAIDVDKDLNKAGWSMEKCVEIIVTRHRTGRDNRLQNVIYNRRIWSRSWGWTARAYNGPNPHDKHAHFSARYTTAQENDTRPWGLLEAATPVNIVVEEFTVATKDEVKQAVIEALELVRPFSTSGPRKRLQDDRPEGQKWGNLSLRGLLEYVFEDAVGPQEASAAALAAFQDEVRAALAQIAADPATSVELSDAQAGEIASELLARMPSVEAIAKAVNDDQSLRMQG